VAQARGFTVTLGGRLAALFPTLHLGLILTCLVAFVAFPSLALGLSFVAVLYLLPVFLYRLHNLFFPLVDGVVDIAKRAYNPWWTTHCLQLTYVAVPLIEGPLHLVPGLFSIWLRMWGSRIGQRVHWTPKVEIVDRGLLDIGDDVVVGHLAGFCSHAITPRSNQMLLIVRRIVVGPKAFVGAESRMGPGAVLASGEMLKVRGVLYWKGALE
jgi:hypothetical protein